MSSNWTKQDQDREDARYESSVKESEERDRKYDAQHLSEEAFISKYGVSQWD